MGLAQQRTDWVVGFKGLRESQVPGAKADLTPSCSNVKFRHGEVRGRGGMTKYKSISTAMSTTPILGLFNYTKVSGTHELLRMSPSNVEKESGGAWSDVTPVTTLTGTSTTRPQYDIIDDILVFTNEGEDTPKKYTGSGDFSDISTSPPYCKAICAYMGFLFLINISDNGTFTDVTDGYRSARFNDDWNGGDWTPCENNLLVFDETAGAAIAACVLGRSMYVFKTDGIVKVTWTGGKLQFNQEKVKSDVGCLAPLSVKRVGEVGIIFLGSDGLVYLLTDGQPPQPISHGWITDTLFDLINSDSLQYARAMVDSEEDTYYLALNSSGLSGQAHDAYISYNFRTKEWSKGTFEKDIYALEVFKATEYVSEKLLVSTSDLVEEFDSTAIDDDGVRVVRSWTSGEQKMQEEGWFCGARFNFARNGRARVVIDVAFDQSQNFEYPMTFDLKGVPGDTNVEITYKVPAPMECQWYNVRVRFRHLATTAETVMKMFGPWTQQVQPVADLADRSRPQTGA